MVIEKGRERERESDQQATFISYPHTKTAFNVRSVLMNLQTDASTKKILMARNCSYIFTKTVSTSKSDGIPKTEKT